MLVHPIESAGTHQWSFKGALPSVIVHGLLLLGAVKATQHFTAEADAAPESVTPLVYRAPMQRQVTQLPQRAGAGAPTTTPVISEPPHTPIDFTVPTTLHGIDVSTAVPVSRDELGSGVSGRDPGLSAGGIATSGTYTGDQVERQAAPLAGNPDPRYPEPLRAASVQGSVIARFVVDTVGRVEAGSFSAVQSDNELFTESVAAALARSRFRPAEFGGHRVRQLVEQRFTFTVR